MLALFGWGLILLLPTDTFSRSAAFAPMRALTGWLSPSASEMAWGIKVLLLSLYALYAFWTGCSKHRRRVLAVSAGFWFFVDLTFFLVNPWGISMATYTLLLLNAIWASWRLLVIDGM